MSDTPASPFAAPASTHELEAGLQFTPRFDAAGLIPAIAADADSGDVLMFAWMNAEALARTIETAQAHFWSRSRSRLWLKGEESGNILDVLEMRTDCDQDAIWMRVRIRLVPGQQPAACHTGRRSCFYRSVPLGSPVAAGSVQLAPANGEPT